MSDDADRDKLVQIIDTWVDDPDLSEPPDRLADAILAEFLPEHDKQVLGEAWDEGARLIRKAYESMHSDEFEWDGGYETISALIATNPYRRES